MYLLYIFIPRYGTHLSLVWLISNERVFVLYNLTLLFRLVFWLHNLLCFAFVDIYHGLVVPLRFLLVNTQNYFNDYMIHQHHCHHEH